MVVSKIYEKTFVPLLPDPSWWKFWMQEEDGWEKKGEVIATGIGHTALFGGVEGG